MRLRDGGLTMSSRLHPPRLHLLMSADPRALKDCRAFARPGDAVLLVDRGVDLLGSPDTATLRSQFEGVALAALEADVVAAGLLAQAGHCGVPLQSDAAWVEQVCRATQVLSWK